MGRSVFAWGAGRAGARGLGWVQWLDGTKLGSAGDAGFPATVAGLGVLG